MLCSCRLVLANQHAIHRTVAQRHCENDESAGNHRRARRGDIEVAATRPDDETQSESDRDPDHSCYISFRWNLNAATAQEPVISAATIRANAVERFTACAPTKAPITSARIAATRRRQRGFSPPAKRESAPSPVIVNVRTVVVRSGRPILRTTAFRYPMAAAVMAITQ